MLVSTLTIVSIVSGHISELCERASKKVGILMRLRNLIPCSAKLTDYKSSIPPFFLSYLTLPIARCLVWDFYKASNIEK